MKKITPKLKAWETYEFKICIQTDEEGGILDVNISNYPYPFNSISLDCIEGIEDIINDLLERE